MGDWGFPLLLLAAAAVVVVNTRLAITAESAERQVLAAVGVLCEVVAFVAVVSTLLVG